MSYTWEQPNTTNVTKCSETIGELKAQLEELSEQLEAEQTIVSAREEKIDQLKLNAATTATTTAEDMRLKQEELTTSKQKSERQQAQIKELSEQLEAEQTIVSAREEKIDQLKLNAATTATTTAEDMRLKQEELTISKQKSGIQQTQIKDLNEQLEAEKDIVSTREEEIKRLEDSHSDCDDAFQRLKNDYITVQEAHTELLEEYNRVTKVPQPNTDRQEFIYKPSTLTF